MSLTILCVGDVVGTPGRQVLRDALRDLSRTRNPDCVIVNAENAAGGSGLTADLYEKLIGFGTHLITLGDHAYRRKDIIPVLEKGDRIVRPANLPSASPGREFAIHHTSTGTPVAVVSLLGRLYMNPHADCPFACIDRVLRSIPNEVRIVAVDVHAEATSEKMALGWYLDGRVSIVFGTHTHVPTADERILPRGTAYITDLGMTGPYDSVLGRDKSLVLGTMRTAVPTKLEVAVDDPRLSGIIVEVDESSGRAHRIERIQVRATGTQGDS